YAAIRHGPLGRSELLDDDGDAAKGRQGLIAFVRGRRWLAAVADSWWTAEQALADARPRFRASNAADSARIDAALDEAVRSGEAHHLHETGEPDKMLARDFSLAVRYDVAPALHASIETASATARLTDGKLELWIAA